MPVDVIRAGALDGVPHGFLGRRGGVSHNLYASLNVGLGSGDNQNAVAENREIAVEAVERGARLVTLHQVHSASALIATAPWRDAERPPADGMATATPGLLLGILSADCAPVLLADRDAKVVGAAHAGWKGALGGITDSVIAQMEALGADRKRITAAIGPCIARASYEVDAAFVARFTEADPGNERFFPGGRAGHAQFDLEGYVVHRLAMAAVGRIEALGIDTYAQEDRWFSYRRATHRGEPDYGRQIALIGVRA